jgi:riboflavin synthase
VFTGLVRDVGEVEAIERTGDGARLRVRSGLAHELRAGDSVSVSGACLTVAARDDEGFAADVMNQTLSVTTLGSLAPGDPVNLEPALRAGDPLGGHLVQGHVDATAEVTALAPDGFARRATVAVPAPLAPYLAERGSVTLDGVSLTIATLRDRELEVSLIPETLERTTLGGLAAGSRVNLEVDVVARYLDRLVQGFGARKEVDDG